MQTTPIDMSDHALRVDQTATGRPEPRSTGGQDDVTGFTVTDFESATLRGLRVMDPPPCLPVLPKLPSMRPLVEPAADTAQRQVLQ